MNIQSEIELFHLLFLRHLGEVVDRNFFILKGGCNLRFFMKSIRYSEDIDLDVKITAVETLRKNVRKALLSPSLLHTLQSRGLRVANITEPKQTGTTQRWKIELHRINSETSIPTKIEFSRRKTAPVDSLLEPVDPEIIHRHRLYPILIQHYSGIEAFAQKLDALCSRQAIQTRDLFDLHLLLGQGIQPTLPPAFKKSGWQQTMESIQVLRQEDFLGQVVAYLDPHYAEYYSSPVAWDTIKVDVTEALKKLIYASN